PARVLSVSEARHDRTPPVLEPACFGGVAPHELVADDRKLIGLAQVRRRRVVALQAAFYLRFPFEELASVLQIAATSGRAAWTRKLRERVIDLHEAGGASLSIATLAESLVRAFRETLDGPLVAAEPTAGERAATAALVRDKYAAPGWTYRR